MFGIQNIFFYVQNFKPILMTFLTTTAVKKLVIDLLKSIAQQTTNTLDDRAVAMLENNFFHCKE